MSETTNAYGLWSLVIINSAVFIMFAFSFFKPQTATDWRTSRQKEARTNTRSIKGPCEAQPQSVQSTLHTKYTLELLYHL